MRFLYPGFAQYLVLASGSDYIDSFSKIPPPSPCRTAPKACRARDAGSHSNLRKFGGVSPRSTETRWTMCTTELFVLFSKKGTAPPSSQAPGRAKGWAETGDCPLRRFAS